VSDLSLKIPEGELFVLLGPSGSGKSTVLRLIAGLLEADGGRILLRGREVTALPPKERGVGFVFQHYALFPHRTVAGNVAFGLEARGLQRTEIHERVRRALGMVRLERLGDRGIAQLSGGQKQRAAIARALVRSPRLLVLDDAFSSVDTETEENILGSVLAATGGRTLLLVSHRLSTVRRADRIVVLDAGRVVETGTHEALMAAGGAYRRLVERQLLAEELERRVTRLFEPVDDDGGNGGGG